MSRSKRKNPICGNTTAKSDKWFKRWVNRVFRRKVKQLGPEEEYPISLDEVATEWLSDKDGKQYFDPDKHLELMRK